MKGRSFSGCLYVAAVNDSGTVTGKWEHLGEAFPLSLKLTEEVIKVRGRTCTTNGNIIGTKTKPADAGGSLTLFDYIANNVARMVKGSVATRAVSSSSLSAEAVTLGKYDEYADIGAEDLTSVVVKDDSDTDTYVEDTDYTINSVLGLISPIRGGDIAEDEVVHITATVGANTDERITIGAGSTAKVALKGSLTDDFTGDVCKVYLRMVTLTANNEVILLSDEATEREQLDFELTPEIPSGQTDYGYIDGLPLGG